MAEEKVKNEAQKIVFIQSKNFYQRFFFTSNFEEILKIKIKGVLS
jgi:hypothetical protein